MFTATLLKQIPGPVFPVDLKNFQEQIFKVHESVYIANHTYRFC